MYAGAAQKSRPLDPVVESVGKTHKELLNKFTGHLSDDDFAYFQKWDRLIDLEADAGCVNVAEAWLIDSAEREKTTSKCISSLYFDPSASSSGAMFDDTETVTIAFKRSPQSPLQTPLQCLSFEPGAYVVLSTDSTTVEGKPDNKSRPQMQIIRGTVEGTSDTQVLLKASSDDLTRIERLVKRSLESVVLFRLDRDEISTGVGTLRQNIINLFTGDTGEPDGSNRDLTPHRLAWLRDVIVRLRTPVFDDALKQSMFSRPDNHDNYFPISGCDLEDLVFEFTELNDDQREAVTKVITAKDYSLIQGLPGTGKTSTIAFVARLLVAHGKRVLITSYTHAAVDNVLLKLIEKGLATANGPNATPALIRVGRESSSHPGVRSILSSVVAQALELQSCQGKSDGNAIMPSADYLRYAVSAARIVGVTALSAPRSPLLVGQHFDVVIVDEAGQITQPAAIGALMAADSFVLLGDHMQLPPLVRSELAEQGGTLAAAKCKYWTIFYRLTLYYTAMSFSYRLRCLVAETSCRGPARICGNADDAIPNER